MTDLVNETEPTPTRPTPLWRRLPGILTRLIVWACLLAVIGAEAIAWLMPQDFSNDGKWYIRFATGAFFVRVFQLHIAIGMVGVILLALIARGWKAAGVAMLITVCLFLPFAREYVPRTPPASATKTLRIFSANLWEMNRNEDAIVAAIEEADPDVLVLAEVSWWSSSKIIHPKLKAKYPYHHVNRYDGGADVLSRVPFRVEKPVAPQDPQFTRQPIIFSIEGREFVMFPVHLVSPGHPWLVKRNRKQVESFVQIAQAETRPMMILGDFNFTPLTPNYARLRTFGFRSTHDLAGYGIGTTWGPRWHPRLNRLPGVRIDHILIRPPLIATFHQVGKDNGSDHRPIVADIGFEKP